MTRLLARRMFAMRSADGHEALYTNEMAADYARHVADEGGVAAAVEEVFVLPVSGYKQYLRQLKNADLPARPQHNYLTCLNSRQEAKALLKSIGITI